MTTEKKSGTDLNFVIFDMNIFNFCMFFFIFIIELGVRGILEEPSEFEQKKKRARHCESPIAEPLHGLRSARVSAVSFGSEPRRGSIIRRSRGLMFSAGTPWRKLCLSLAPYDASAGRSLA